MIIGVGFITLLSKTRSTPLIFVLVHFMFYIVYYEMNEYFDVYTFRAKYKLDRGL